MEGSTLFVVRRMPFLNKIRLNKTHLKKSWNFMMSVTCLAQYWFSLRNIFTLVLFPSSRAFSVNEIICYFQNYN